MSGWKAKRFWTRAEAAPCPGGFAVLLDGRPVKTPGKAAFVLPSRAMADACAAEWEAQSGAVNPSAMPMTRYANSAIDKVALQHAEVAEIVAAYGETDLLCYRADAPPALAARQAAAWEPHLAWAAEVLGAPLRVTAGVVPVPQDPGSLARLAAQVQACDPFRLAALHDLVAITGSLVLGLAMARGRLEADAAFALSRIDEHWQAEVWGQDDDAGEIEARKQGDLVTALRFFRLCGQDSFAADAGQAIKLPADQG